MKINRIETDKFWEIYKPLCKPIQGLSEEEENVYAVEIERLTEKLEDALKEFNPEDFQISDEGNPCWHHCAGVYGKSAFTSKFLRKIFDVLTHEKKDWCFHLALEEDFGNGDMGQIFYYKGEFYADAGDSLDYSVFER